MEKEVARQGTRLVAREAVEADINTIFCRELLKSVMADVRKHTTADERKAAWVYCTYRHGGNNQFEFHGPSDFYWHGRADNANDARAKGWEAWLRSKGFEESADAA